MARKFPGEDLGCEVWDGEFDGTPCIREPLYFRRFARGIKIGDCLGTRLLIQKGWDCRVEKEEKFLVLGV